MAAGLGFKDFTTGEVLTAADVDGYLMQGVWVFASAAARDAAVTSPQEGNFAYLKDTNVTTYYTGSAWANLDTTGMTNPMTTAGDTIYGGASGTPTRLAIGSTGDVLTVSGGNPVWAAPTGSTESWSLFNSGGTALTGATTVTVSGISGVNQIMVLVVSASSVTAGSRIAVRLNGDTASNYYAAGSQNTYESTYSSANFARMAGLADDRFFISRVPSSTAAEAVAGTVLLKGCNGTGLKIASTFGGGNGGSGQESFIGAGYYNSSSTISSVSVVSQSGNLDNGTVYVYTSVA